MLHNLRVAQRVTTLGQVKQNAVGVGQGTTLIPQRPVKAAHVLRALQGNIKAFFTSMIGKAAMLAGCVNSVRSQDSGGRLHVRAALPALGVQGTVTVTLMSMQVIYRRRVYLSWHTSVCSAQRAGIIIYKRIAFVILAKRDSTSLNLARPSANHAVLGNIQGRRDHRDVRFVLRGILAVGKAASARRAPRARCSLCNL
jgi:hypothetical protein